MMRRAGLTPYTRLALEASEYAKTTGLFEPFHKGLYHAFWAEGKDLGKIDVVREVGEAVGLDGSELTRHLESRSYKEIIEAQYAEALQIGVTGIPAFIIGRFFFMGAQPYELFQQVAQRAQAKMEEEKDHLQP